jgi:hypothetical protein
VTANETLSGARHPVVARGIFTICAALTCCGSESLQPEYDQILAAQGGVCAICGNICRTGRALAVDHDHQNGVVRALLCLTCNRNLGIFENFRELAEDYLNVYGAGNPLLQGDRIPATAPFPLHDRANAKLTDDRVREIRLRYATGKVSQSQLAREFGVAQISISRIVRQESWRHVA